MKILFLGPSSHIELLCPEAYFSAIGRAENEVSMLDILFVAIGLGFLAAAMLYAVACDRL